MLCRGNRTRGRLTPFFRTSARGQHSLAWERRAFLENQIYTNFVELPALRLLWLTEGRAKLGERVRGTKSISGQNVIIIRQIAVRSYYRPFWKGGGKACGSCLGLVVLVVMVKRATVMSAFYECLGDTKFPVT